MKDKIVNLRDVHIEKETAAAASVAHAASAEIEATVDVHEEPTAAWFLSYVEKLPLSSKGVDAQGFVTAAAYFLRSRKRKMGIEQTRARMHRALDKQFDEIITAWTGRKK